MAAAPGEGLSPNIAEGADKEEAQSAAKGAPVARVVGKPEPWQAAALLLLQQRSRDAQRDLLAAMRSFEPEPGCSLVNGGWVKDGK